MWDLVIGGKGSEAGSGVEDEEGGSLWRSASAAGIVAVMKEGGEWEVLGVYKVA